MWLCLSVAVSAALPQGISVLGVIVFEDHAKAMVRVPDMERPLLVSPGDLLLDYTVYEVTDGRIVLAREDACFAWEAGAATPTQQKTPAVEPLSSFLLLDQARSVRPGAGQSLADVLAPPREELEKSLFDDTPASRKIKPVCEYKVAVNMKADLEALTAKNSKGSHPAFIRPMQGWVSSPFGPRRRMKTRMGMSSGNHLGIDIAAPHGTSVYATAEGVVARANPYRNNPKGRYVILQHANGYESRYYHLYKVYVKTGEKVRLGQRIGREGNTGISTGSHLHFEIRKNGTPVDPALFIPSLRKQ